MFLGFFQVSWSDKPQFSESKVFGKYSYCWWQKSCTSWYASLSHYLQGFIYPRWCIFFASTVGILRIILNKTHAVWANRIVATFSVSRKKALSGSRDCFGRNRRQFPTTSGGPANHREIFPRLVTLGTEFVCEGASCCLGSWWDGRTGGWERFQHEQWKNGTGCLDFRGMVWGWYYAPLEQMIAHYGTLGIWESLLRNQLCTESTRVSMLPSGYHILSHYPLSFISSTSYSSLPTSLVYW